MIVNTVGRIKNKSTTYNSFLTYAVGSLCFWFEDDSPEREAAAGKKVCSKILKLTRILPLRIEISLTLTNS